MHDDIILLYEEAKKACNQEHYKEAFVMFSELIIKDSRKTDYILWLGKIYLKQNQVFYARKCFKEILSRASELNLKEEAKQLLAEIDTNKAASNNILYSESNNKVKKLTNQSVTDKDIQSLKKIQVITEKETQSNKHNSNFSLLNIVFFLGKKINMKNYFIRKLNLKTKTTLTAVSLGIVPIFIVGATVFQLANNFISIQIQAEKQAKVLAITDKVNRFLLERYSNVQTLANIPAFRDSQIGQFYTSQHKQLLLNNFVDTYKFYDSVAIFTTKGKLLVQSSGKKLDNYSNRSFFQEVLTTSNPIISGPEISQSSGDLVLHFAAPIKDRFKGLTVGVVVSRVPVRYIEELIREFGVLGDQYYLVNQEGKIFISQLRQYLRQDAHKNFPDFNELQKANQVEFKIGVHQQTTDTISTLIAYAPFNKLEGLPQQNWSAVISTPTDFALAPQRQLFMGVIISTGLTALIVSIAAVILAEQGTSPILKAVHAIQQLGQGNLEAKAVVVGEDEVAVLSNNINLISSRIQLTVEQIKNERLAAEEARKQAVAIAEEHRKRQELMQNQLFELQKSVERVAAGDLTVRAKVTDSELGVVADFFNLIIEKWQKFVVQFGEITDQVNISVTNDEVAIRILANEVNQQAIKIADALKEFKQITEMIQEVISSVKQTSAAATATTEIVESSKQLIKHTVEAIFKNQENVTKTTKRIKQLEGYSQQISDIVIIINDVALQTKLFAVNTEIKMAQYNEKEKQGFSLLIEEFTPLATKYVNTTYKLEQIANNIQLETNRVLQATKVDASQSVEQTQLVLNTRKCLEQIVRETYQFHQQVDLILDTTLFKTEVFQNFTYSIQQLSESCDCTIVSFQEVLELSPKRVQLVQNLQAITNYFKVR